MAEGGTNSVQVSTEDLYTQCRVSLTSMENHANQVRSVIMNAFKITVSKSTQCFVFPKEEKVLKPEFSKDTVTAMLNALNRIIEKSQKAEDVIASLETANDAACKKLANEIIEKVSSKCHHQNSSPTYAEKLRSMNQSPNLQIGGKEPGHVLIINTKDSAVAYEEIQNKINLRQNKIKLAKAPYVKNKNTIIMSFTEEEHLNSMKTNLEKLNLPETTAKQSKKLNPTIRIFDVGNVDDNQISEEIEEITGSKPLLVSGKTSIFSKKRNVLVRLTKEQYYSLIEKSPDNKLQVEYNRFRFERYISVRSCRKCKGVGHSEDYCRLKDDFKHVVEACEKNRVCTSCALKEYDGVILDVSDPKIALERVFTKVTHGAFSSSCTEYVRQLKILEKRYDF